MNTVVVVMPLSPGVLGVGVDPAGGSWHMPPLQYPLLHSSLQSHVFPLSHSKNAWHVVLSLSHVIVVPPPPSPGSSNGERAIEMDRKKIAKYIKKNFDFIDNSYGKLD